MEAHRLETNNQQGPDNLAKRYLTAQQAADYLSLSVWTIYRKVEHRQIPFISLGTAGGSVGKSRKPIIRFDVKVLDRWMEQQTIESVD